VVSLRQNDMTVQKYHDVFVQSMEVLRLCGGDIGITRDAVNERLTADGIANPTGNQILAMTTQMEQEDMAVMFILGADNRCYAILKQELLNDYSKGHDNYLTTLAKARMMLATRQDKTTVLGVRRTDQNNNNTNNNNNNSDVAVTTDGQTRPRGGDGSCFCCGSRDHRANNCPNRRTTTGNTNVTNGNGRERRRWRWHEYSDDDELFICPAKQCSAQCHTDASRRRGRRSV
jgi:hypothetical protein